LNFTNVPNPIFSGSDTTFFTLTVSDIFGCVDSGHVTVNVYIPDAIVLPNVITPDGDGLNDVWKINPKLDLTGSHLVIFNRWGETVYETDNYGNNWGGTYKGTGRALPDGTYYYVLKVPLENNHTYTGAINILNSQAK
jgi:gliding motility-associated-like protein